MKEKLELAIKLLPLAAAFLLLATLLYLPGSESPWNHNFALFLGREAIIDGAILLLIGSIIFLIRRTGLGPLSKPTTGGDTRATTLAMTAIALLWLSLSYSMFYLVRPRYAFWKTFVVKAYAVEGLNKVALDAESGRLEDAFRTATLIEENLRFGVYGELARDRSNRLDGRLALSKSTASLGAVNATNWNPVGGRSAYFKLSESLRINPQDQARAEVLQIMFDSLVEQEIPEDEARLCLQAADRTYSSLPRFDGDVLRIILGHFGEIPAAPDCQSLMGDGLLWSYWSIPEVRCLIAASRQAIDGPDAVDSDYGARDPWDTEECYGSLGFNDYELSSSETFLIETIFNPANMLATKSRRNARDGLRYVWIPPGEFEMGCSLWDGRCQDHEKPRHPVRIDTGFWMGQTEVTIAAYIRFAKSTGGSMPYLVSDEWNSQFPIVDVTSFDARSYCEYAGGRLPSEAEWEYAARGGLYGKIYPWGNEAPSCMGGARSGAKSDACSPKTLGIVGSYYPNGYGLFDMAGNVWEWCEDDWHKSYAGAPENGDAWRKDRSSYGVLRGGAWVHGRDSLRVSARRGYFVDYRETDAGFRCVLSSLP